jgi:two-component system sensor histidine kinase YesM
MFGIFKSVFSKFLLTFITVGILPMVILGIVTLGVTRENIKTGFMANSENALSNMVNLIDKDITDFENIKDGIVGDDYGIFDEIYPQPYLNGEHINEKLMQALRKNANIENVIIINKEGDWAFVSKNKKFANSFFELKDSDILSEIIKGKGKNVTIPTHSEVYFQNSSSPNYIISFGTGYYAGGEYAGSVIIDIKAEYFAGLISRLENFGADSVSVIDQSGYCVYSTKIFDIAEFVSLDSIPVVNAYGGGDLAPSFYLKSASDASGWDVYMKISADSVFANIKTVERTFFTIVPLILLVLLITAVNFSAYMTRPIKKIALKTEMIKNGDLDVRLDIGGEDELGRLSAAINEMTEGLKKAYYYKIRQKEAELNSIKMQIKPHFLYNTLEIIRMTAIDENARKAGEMVTALSRQMRYIMDGGEDIVSIGKEIDMAVNYLNFVRPRYNCAIKFTNNADENIMGLGMPKLIIQPLIENSLKHGITSEMTEFVIALTGEIRDGDVTVTVFDNGAGIPRERLPEILSRLSESEVMPNSNIGLKSIHERIRLLFGDKYGIKIESYEGMGTNVSISFPKLEV